ncbi:MAG: hypothetical protein ACRD5J_07445, partial [Nitrososphaeraceae archaeon]
CDDPPLTNYNSLMTCRYANGNSIRICTYVVKQIYFFRSFLYFVVHTAAAVREYCNRREVKGCIPPNV